MLVKRQLTGRLFLTLTKGHQILDTQALIGIGSDNEWYEAKVLRVNKSKACLRKAGKENPGGGVGLVYSSPTDCAVERGPLKTDSTLERAPGNTVPIGRAGEDLKGRTIVMVNGWFYNKRRGWTMRQYAALHRKRQAKILTAQ